MSDYVICPSGFETFTEDIEPGRKWSTGTQNQIFVGLFQKNLRMDKVSIAEVVGRIFLVICTVIAI